MRLSVWLLLAAGAAWAQFQDLATSDDGSILYFSSAQRLDRATQNLYLKLFRMDATGIHLHAQQAPGEDLGRTTSNFYELAGADVSADGTVLAYTASRPCYGGSGCIPVERFQGHITGLPGQSGLIFTGRVRISRNARYAVTFGASAFFNNPGAQLVDLQTNQTAALPRGYNVGGSGRRCVALDGTVVVSSGVQLALWRTSGVQTLANSQPPVEPMINDAATLVIYETTGAAPQLIAYDVNAARETILAAGASPFHAAMNGDGSLILFLNHSQAWIVRGDGAGSRRLTSDPDGIAEAALTGNGRIAYAITGAGRILRIDVVPGTVTELVPRTPNIDRVDQAVPGSLLRVVGSGLADGVAAGTVPLPGALGGVQVKLGGVPMPLALVSPTGIRWQVPWDWPAGDTPFQLISGKSPFEGSPETLSVSPVSPNFYGDAGNILAVHSPWDALVTEQNPAQPGEVLHLYLSGLGPVTPPVATGVPSPAGPLARVITIPRCQFWDGGPNDAEVLYAGLAPGMIGIYQMELRVPSGLRLTPVSVVCEQAENPGAPATGLLPVALAPR
jgi:uncharacterized protein (TIGR03437 family)